MLNTLPKLTSRSQKRLGRGFGSGVGGHTVGRGTKGHSARQGKKTPLWFEGGQLPLIKRLPYWRGKFQFKALGKEVQEVQVEQLTKIAGQDVTLETLFAAKLIKSLYLPVKVIGKSESLTRVGEVRGVSLSASARATIEKAGGKVV